MTFSQQAGKPVVRNLNELEDEAMAAIRKYLATKRLTEYRHLVSVLNQEVFEKHFKFTIAIDQYPTLEMDGC